VVPESRATIVERQGPESDNVCEPALVLSSHSGGGGNTPPPRICIGYIVSISSPKWFQMVVNWEKFLPTETGEGRGGVESTPSCFSRALALGLAFCRFTNKSSYHHSLIRVMPRWPGPGIFTWAEVKMKMLQKDDDGCKLQAVCATPRFLLSCK
jgi:hypothetical protein